TTLFRSHNHFSSFWKYALSGYVGSTEVELRTIFVKEWSVTSTFFFAQYVNFALEFGVRSDASWLTDNHTTTDLGFIDTTERQTCVMNSLTLIEEFAEHFNTGNGRRQRLIHQTHDFNRITYFNDTSFDTTCSNSTTTGDREYVFNTHQEWLIDWSWRKRNVVVYSFHQFFNRFHPFFFTGKSTGSRTFDDWSVVSIETI